MSHDEKNFSLEFPVITISVSYDDLNEPVHVDLGSIPPFIAASILEKVVSVLKLNAPMPKITFNGDIIAGPFSPGGIDFESFFIEDDDQEEE